MDFCGRAARHGQILKFCFSLLIGCGFLFGTAAAQTTTKPVQQGTNATQAQTPQLTSRADQPASTSDAFAPDHVAISMDGRSLTVAQYTETIKSAGAPEPQYLPPADRRREATMYTNLMALAAVARREGLDKTPEVQEKLRLQQEQLLASLAYRKLAQDAGQISPEEVQSYYNAHPAEFEQIRFQRLFIRSTGPNDEQARTKAEEFHKRAAAGADFDQLAKELANATTAVSSDIGAHTPGTLGLSPQNDAAAFQLKAGEVSSVFQEPTGYFIFKAGEHKHLTLAEATPRIHQQLTQKRLNDSLEQARQSMKIDLNDAFFNAPAAPRPQMPSLRSSAQAPAQPTPPQNPAPPK